MKALELWDLKDHRFLSLSEVLAPLPGRAVGSYWDITGFIGPDGAPYFEVGYDGDEGISRLADTGTRVSGRNLVQLAGSSSQVIWATLSGYDSREAIQPWIALHAVDSTFWRCETRDIGTRQALMKAFNDVRLAQ